MTCNAVPKNVIFLGFLFLEELRSIEDASRHTLSAYARDINQFAKDPKGHRLGLFAEKSVGIFFQKKLFLSEKKQFEAEKIAISDFLELLSEALSQWSPLSPASRNRKLSCLKSFSKWLARNNYIESDISHRIPSPKVPQKIPHFLSVDEVSAVIASLKKRIEVESTVLAIQDLTLVYLLYGLGLRVSEACHLRWKDISWTQKNALIATTKGGGQRYVTIPDVVYDFLKQQPHKDSLYVWGEKPMVSRTAYQRVRNAGEDAGLSKPLNPHALRHSYATHLLSSGSDLRILQELLGHKSLAATQKYTHMSMDGLIRTMETHHPLGDSTSE